MIWRCLNLELAFRKGQASRAVDWIGCQLRLTSVGVIAQLQAESVIEMQKFVTEALAHNAVSEKALR